MKQILNEKEIAGKILKEFRYSNDCEDIYLIFADDTFAHYTASGCYDNSVDISFGEQNLNSKSHINDDDKIFLGLVTPEEIQARKDAQIVERIERQKNLEKFKNQYPSIIIPGL